MRTIKFRSWSKRYKKYINAAFRSADGALYAEDGEDDCILEQFASLLDKNGKEIYEGDILDYQASPKYVVVFERAAFWLCVKGLDGVGLILMPDKVIFMEVIGNIHESPELLK